LKIKKAAEFLITPFLPVVVQGSDALRSHAAEGDQRLCRRVRLPESIQSTRSRVRPPLTEKPQQPRDRRRSGPRSVRNRSGSLKPVRCRDGEAPAQAL